jgi:hypothetical protein
MRIRPEAVGAADRSAAPRPSSRPAGATDTGERGRQGRGRAQGPPPGFAPPAGATIADGTPRSRPPAAPIHRGCDRRAGSANAAARSGAAQRNRDETRALLRLHAHQHAALAFACGHRSAPCERRPASRRSCRDLEDHVAGLEAEVGGRTRGATSATTTPGSLPAGASDRPKSRLVAAARIARPALAARLALLGSSPSVRLRSLLGALADDPSLTVLAVDRHDHVAGLDAGLDRRAVLPAARRPARRRSFKPRLRRSRA